MNQPILGKSADLYFCQIADLCASPWRIVRDFLGSAEDLNLSEHCSFETEESGDYLVKVCLKSRAVWVAALSWVSSARILFQCVS